MCHWVQADVSHTEISVGCKSTLVHLSSKGTTQHPHCPTFILSCVHALCRSARSHEDRHVSRCWPLTQAILKHYSGHESDSNYITCESALDWIRFNSLTFTYLWPDDGNFMWNIHSDECPSGLLWCPLCIRESWHTCSTAKVSSSVVIALIDVHVCIHVCIMTYGNSNCILKLQWSYTMLFFVACWFM